MSDNGAEACSPAPPPDKPQGTAAAVEDAYRAHGARMWRALYASCGNREVADDAVAEAYAQALRRGDAIHALVPWLWRTVFRIAAGQLQERSRMRPLDERPEAPAETHELLEALATLTPRSRQIVVLHYYAGFSATEIGGILAMSPSAVRVRLLRARRQLRTQLEETSDE